ncbi:MAG: hypothetical protein ACFFDI_16755 [Promethearchaeota archaeon]
MSSLQLIKNIYRAFLGLSLLGLGLVPLLVLKSTASLTWFPWRLQIVGGIFISICLLGIVAALSPVSCQTKKISHSTLDKIVNNRKISNNQPSISIRGHHPTCGHYSAHVFHIRGKIYCTGCTGLATGALVAITGSFLYFFLEFPLFNPTLIFWGGFLGVTVGLLQHPLYDFLKIKKSIVRVFVNILFVIGAFLLLVGVDYFVREIIIDLYILAMIVFWILSRIFLSKLSHRKICLACGLESCQFS